MNMNFQCGNMIFNPCKDCTFRDSTCHVDCEKYKAFKQEIAEMQEKYHVSAGHNEKFEEYRQNSKARYLHRKALKSK